MKISIILPNFNHAALITQAFEGMLAQTYQNWQLCVVDDGSTDDSWTVIKRYRDRDSRIVAEKSRRNRGVNETLRRGQELCTGELLYPAAADDYLSNSRFFELAVTALQRFPQAAAAYGRATIVDANDGRQIAVMGSCVPTARAHASVRDEATGIAMQFVPPREALARFVSHRMFIPGCSVILRRVLMAELGVYDDALGPQADYFLNHALAALHGAVFIDAPVAVARVAASTYNGSASDDDYFRRHALVERKIRTLALPYGTDERLFAQYRSATINSRFAEAFQRRLLDAARGVCSSVPPGEAQMFPPDLAAFVTSLQKDCARLETNLNDQLERAQAIFNEVAGPIGSLPAGSESGPRPWLRTAAEFFLTLGRTLTDFGNWLWTA